MLAYGAGKDAVIDSVKAASLRNKAEWDSPEKMKLTYAFFTSHVL